MFMCVRGADVFCFYDFSIGFRKCSDSGIFLFFFYLSMQMKINKINTILFLTFPTISPRRGWLLHNLFMMSIETLGMFPCSVICSFRSYAISILFSIPKEHIFSESCRGFEPRSGQTKDYKIGMWCFSAKHTTQH